MTRVLFPSWRYHATERACIVANQAESDALGAGWSDSPATVEATPVVAPDVPDAEYPADEDEPADEPKKRHRKSAK